jgi:type I restriction enzyme S subunit
MSVDTVKLGDALNLYNGKAPVLSENGEVTVFGSNGVIGKSEKANHPRSIILGRVGAYCGAVKFSDDPFWASDNTIVVRPVEGHDLKYWYYKLQSIPLRGYAGGAAQPLITHTIIKPLETLVHNDVIQQQRIASILSAYDDLIENNRRRIALLEETARLLYREWFVHFRFPGHEHVKIIDDVPEGWKQGTIDDLFKTSSGGTPSRKKPEYYGGDINWLKTQEMNDGYVFSSGEKITEEGLKGSSAKLFPKNTVVVAMYGATIGKLCILASPSTTNQACCALLPKHDEKDYLKAYPLGSGLPTSCE